MSDFNHANIYGDFGYIWCRACGGQWEGPEKPDNSPCSREAQAIRYVRGHFEYLLNSKKYVEAAEYLNISMIDRPLAFDRGGLKEVYWNKDGSTL